MSLTGARGDQTKAIVADEGELFSGAVVSSADEVEFQIRNGAFVGVDNASSLDELVVVSYDNLLKKVIRFRK